jgi:transposase
MDAFLFLGYDGHLTLPKYVHFAFPKIVDLKLPITHLPVDPAQLNLFEQYEMTEEEKEQLAKEVGKAEETFTFSVTRKVKPSRKPLDDSKLPVKEIHIYPEGTTNEDGTLKAEYVEIGIEEKRTLETVPARVYITKTIRHKVIRRSDVETKLPEDRQILIPALPLEPVERCIAGASVLTDIIIGKFMYHLPFYRQIGQYKEAGITLSDSTMGDWYEAAVEKLKLLYDLLRKQILQSEYIQVDESVVPVIDNEKHKARKGYEWCVRDAISGDVMFYYDRGSRGYHVARELLGGYKGNAQTDGYDAYAQFEKQAGITMHGCWAYVRRKFVAALEAGDKKHATEAIVYISKLYKVESDADEAKLTESQRKALRQKIALPLINVFEKWMLDTYPNVLPKSKTGEAIAYTYTLLPRLARYVNDGRINIDNNLIENAIRPLALGRKNWLFCGNDASAYRAAIVYSLISTCKNAGIEPRIWMEDVLRKIPYYLRDGRDLAELLPRIWATRIV